MDQLKYVRYVFQHVFLCNKKYECSPKTNGSSKLAFCKFKFVAWNENVQELCCISSELSKQNKP